MGLLDVDHLRMPDLIGDPVWLALDGPRDDRSSGDELVHRNRLAQRFRRQARQIPCIEPRVQCPDPFEDRRVRGEKPADALREQHVRHLFGAGGRKARALRQTRDLDQRSLQAFRIACELHGRRIRESLALAADGRLKNPPGERSHVAEHHDGRRRGQQADGTSSPAAARHDPQDGAADQRKHEQTEQPAHELHVQPHIAVENVAEFVGDHSLELIPIESLESAPRDGHRRVRRRVAGREGVDPRLLFQHVDLGHGHAGGDGHFLDHVVQPFQPRIGRVPRHLHSAQRARHCPTAGPELQRLPDARQPQHAQNEHRAEHGAARMTGGVIEGREHRAVGAQGGQEGEQDEIERRSHSQQRQDEPQHQPARLPACGGLSGEEVHADPATAVR